MGGRGWLAHRLGEPSFSSTTIPTFACCSRRCFATLDSPRLLAESLTARELEVLRLLAGGLTQADIANQLLISGKTVGTHIEHILMKLDVPSRAQAVAVAYRENLVEPTVAMPTITLTTASRPSSFGPSLLPAATLRMASVAKAAR